MKLEEARILLRPWRESDAKRLFEIYNEHYMGTVTSIPQPYKLKDAKDFVKRRIAEWKNGQTLGFAIIWKESMGVIGDVSLIVKKRHNNAELAYTLAKQFRGMGVMPEAASLLLEYGFKKMKFHRISVSHMDGNNASRRVIKKLGFKFEGRQREAGKPAIGKAYKDLLVYSILKKEWAFKKSVQGCE